MKPERRTEDGKSRNQNKANPDQEKAISMAQAFKLLILIFSIIGLVVNHLAITPVKSWHHYIQTITVVFTRFWHCTMHMSHLFLIWEFDKVLLVPALQNRANTS